MVVLVDADSGDVLTHGTKKEVLNELISYYTGRKVIALAPSTDGTLEDYVDYVDGEDCWAGIKYVPESSKFQVEFCCDSSSDLDPVYTFENYYEAIEKAKELVR